MKIIHCLNQYMPMAMAGTEIYVHTLGTLQQEGGHQVAVVTPHIEHYLPAQIKSHYVYEGINVYQFLETGNPTNREVHYGNKQPEGLENFILILNELKPDVIHFHELNRSIGFTVAHVKLAKQFGAKIFLTMHLSGYSCNTNVLIYNNRLCDGIIRSFNCTECSYKTLFNIPAFLAKPLARLSILGDEAFITEKLPDSKVKTLLSIPSSIVRIKKDLDELIRNVDQLISYSKWYKTILIKNGVPKNKITFVPPALVTISKKIINITFRQPCLPVKMVFIGRIQPTKGIHLIIEALSSFLPKEVQIDIYGKQEETAYYLQCISDSKNIKSISWKEEINREDVVDQLTQYDIFCLASTFSEMSPLVIQEAFAAGIPVLASKVYGNMEQIKHGYNGLLFDFNSSKSLGEQIRRIINEPALLLQLKKNIVAPQNFNIVNEAYLKLYASI